jgi:hypothetical protein
VSRHEIACVIDRKRERHTHEPEEDQVREHRSEEEIRRKKEKEPRKMTPVNTHGLHGAIDTDRQRLDYWDGKSAMRESEVRRAGSGSGFCVKIALTMLSSRTMALAPRTRTKSLVWDQVR